MRKTLIILQVGLLMMLAVIGAAGSDETHADCPAAGAEICDL